MNYTITEELVSDAVEQIKIHNFLPEIGADQVRQEIFKALRSTPKSIAPKFFYDAKGSELFEAITQLEEYYPTRTEKSILSKLTTKLDINFRDLNVIELGSGDPSKISLLLKDLPENILRSIDYFPVDISASAIRQSIQALKATFPLKQLTGLVCDFTSQLDKVPKEGQRLFCFFGSTIGNFSYADAEAFMQHLGQVLQKGDHLLLGMDMYKSASILEPAYNDALGVTAQFNLNILNVLNTLAQTNFNTDDFEHYAYLNQDAHRIEMHLKALKDISVQTPFLGETIDIREGEMIHTENSHKFRAEDISRFAKHAQLSIQNIYTDAKGWFSLVHFRK